MVKNHYRWDFIGLSTDTKPTPDTSEKVADGSTFYESDTSKYYVWCQDDWYEKTSTGGGGGGGAVDTVNNVSPDANGNVELTPSDIGAQATLTAGSNITIDDGTISATDTTYSAGTNVSISSGNVISATDTTYSNFVGTDGTAAGTAGLVPAPATTDAGKVLSSDGSWTTIDAGIKTLTTADYNYPANNPQYVLLCLLPAGVYKVPNGISARIGASTAVTSGRDSVAYVDIKPSTGYATITADGSGYGLMTVDVSLSNYGETIKLIYSVEDSLTSSSRKQPLSAYQGRALNNKIEGRIITGSGAPTTSTVGTVGMLYEDTTNGKLYQCTAVSGSTYTWEEVGGGSGPTVVQTTGTSTTDVMSQNAVTSMVYGKPSTLGAITIGGEASISNAVNTSMAIGYSAHCGNYQSAAALGHGAYANNTGAVAIGAYANATVPGQMDIGLGRATSSIQSSRGYNGSAYRLLSGVYDGQSAHDAATVGQLTPAFTNAEFNSIFNTNLTEA